MQIKCQFLFFQNFSIGADTSDFNHTEYNAEYAHATALTDIDRRQNLFTRERHKLVKSRGEFVKACAMNKTPRIAGQFHV